MKKREDIATVAGCGVFWLKERSVVLWETPVRKAQKVASPSD